MQNTIMDSENLCNCVSDESEKYRFRETKILNGNNFSFHKIGTLLIKN